MSLPKRSRLIDLSDSRRDSRMLHSPLMFVLMPENFREVRRAGYWPARRLQTLSKSKNP